MSCRAWILAGFLLLSGGTAAAEPPDITRAEAFFSPEGGATDAVVRELGNAKDKVRVQAYSFTSAPIAQALVDAKARGVDVEVILDKSNRSAKYSSADFLVHHAIPTRLDARHAIAHNKVMIIDGRILITGSFNFTAAAEAHNAENLLILDSPQLAARYLANWEVHAAHSDAYEGR